MIIHNKSYNRVELMFKQIKPRSYHADTLDGFIEPHMGNLVKLADIDKEDNIDNVTFEIQLNSSKFLVEVNIKELSEFCGGSGYNYYL